MAKIIPSEISKPQALRVLMVEDSESDEQLIIRELKKGGYEPEYERVETAAEMKKALKDKQWDIILCDYKMPNFSGAQAITLLKGTNIDIPLIIVSGAIGEETAIECMHKGAHDYIMKTNLSRLCSAITRELEEAEIRVQRKRAEDALRESEERFRKLANATGEGIIIHREGTIMDANELAAKTIGYSIEEIIGKNIITFVAPESIEPVMQKLSEGATHDKLFLELKVLRKDKSIFSAEASGRPIRYKNIDARVLAFRDITERKQAEEELKERENKYHLLADNVHDVIFVLDMNLKYTYVSPSVKILRGYEPEEVMKQTPSKTLTPSSWDLAMKNLAEVLELEKTEHREINISRTLQLEMRRKDGTTVWTEVKFSAIRDENQQPVGILGVTRDITERKQAEEQLQQTLESLKNAVGATIQVMVSAVEMRDPYTAGHQIRVASLACAIATEMGLPKDKIDGLRMAGSIHDIGKLSVPAEILSKPTNLTDIEFSLIKEHSRSGYDILKDVESPWPLAQIVYQHHERMDGSGYPRNLKGEEILIEARILALADVVEAMASHRPYRAALGIEVALEEIEKNKGIFYDNAVVDACLRLFREKGYQLK